MGRPAHVVFYEDLLAQPGAAWRGVLRFLGVREGRKTVGGGEGVGEAREEGGGEGGRAGGRSGGRRTGGREGGSRVVRIANREAPKSGDSRRIARRSIKSRTARIVI